MANDMAEMYDSYDQNPNESSDQTDKENGGYESFLAPKSAFKGDISPGTVHRVKIERALDEELQLRCIEGEKDEPERKDNPQEEESESMY
jgi:hypothetical protein